MFADRAKIYVRSGKGETATFLLEEKNMFLLAVRTVETGEPVEVLFLKWMRE